MSWKRTRAKKALIEVFSTITSEDIVFNYKEIGDKIYIRYMNSKCTGMNLNYFYIISSLVIISIIYIASTSSYNSNTYKKYIKLRLQLNSQDNFTNIDDSNIKDNHKLMYWIAPLNNDIHNIKDNFDILNITPKQIEAIDIVAMEGLERELLGDEDFDF
jgi:hypothetical protein